MKIVIIGGGPAGMMASIAASNGPNDVIILEKNNIVGKKILVTGKGRCNFTNGRPMQEFISNVPGNGKFLYSAFQNFTNTDIIELLKTEGVEVKEERGHRMFPVSDRAEDVRKTLEKVTRKKGVEIITNAEVKRLKYEDGRVTGVELKDKTIDADKVIIATGGKSYKQTGSTGDGYRFAKEAGHTINKIQGSLVPLISRDISCKEMQGLSLKNVNIKIVDTEKNKEIYNDFGEMLFTHFGVSGPTILSASAHLIRYKDIEKKLKAGSIILKIDLKPALSYEQLDARILRDFAEEKNKQFKNSLDQLLPKKMINEIVKKSGINPEKQVNEITKVERTKLVELLKNLEIEINGFRDVDEAIVTAGGVSTKEINPKTMESKLVKNLFFAGEVIDVDAYTGGFNLQIAYSTGYTAGKSTGEI